MTDDGNDELPEGWSKHWSNTWKKHYYFNAKTGKQSWEAPPPEAGGGGGGGGGGEHKDSPRDSLPRRSSSAASNTPVAGKRERGSEGAEQDSKRHHSGSEGGVSGGSTPRAKEEGGGGEGEENPEIAVIRDKEVKKLLTLLRQLTVRSASIAKEPANALTRFFFMAHLQRRKVQPDPLIPTDPGVDTCLHRELLKAGMDPAECHTACTSLSDAATAAAQVVVDAKKNNTRSLKSFVPEVIEKETPNRQVQIVWRDASLLINREHYLKIKKLYDKQGHDGSLFLVRLFCLLQRYETIGGAGYQAAIPAAVFQTLQEEFGVAHECFASPLNCSLPSYGSAFLDVDNWFGSSGSFFQLDFSAWSQGGSFEANPPFMEESMQLMYDVIHQLLLQTEKTSAPTSFIVVVPCWTDERAHEMMRESRFLRRLLILEKSQHSYKSGAQHTSLQQYHDAGFRTSLFFLQNDSGAAKWPVTAAAMRRLEEAFRKWN